jgi:deazaflavin-dependent oxidoreductase (nitroreductase family)
MTEKQHNDPEEVKLFLAKLAGEEYCYVITTGRVSGRPHEIEIWFGLNGDTLFLLSGGGDQSDWVKNMLKTPSVTVRIAKHTFTGVARIVKDEREDKMARYMLAEKYQEWEAGKRLSEWARTALPVAIDLIEESNP